MSSILFEQPHRGNVWRLEVSHYNGASFANFRKWYRHDDVLKPTREGLTFPVDQLVRLQAALDDYLN
jgi:hypothetical protein